MRLAGNTWIPDDDCYFGPIFRQSDVFEPHNLSTGLDRVTEWDCAIDGGAHVGSWTREMAKRFGLVIAFEPQIENFKCLLANTTECRNVDQQRAALSNKFGSATLESGSNSGCWHIAEGSGVQTIPLDTFSGLAGRKVGYLKLDVEGYEWFALDGARSLLARDKPVVQIEEKPLSHKYASPTARSLLEGMGYQEVARAGRDVIFVKE